jgi:dynein light chain roadblock-type
MSQKVEETINRIGTHMGVLGVMIVNHKGVALRSTMSQNDTIEYGSLITQFAAKAQGTLKSLHPEEDISFISIRSNKHEIMIAPDREFCLIVL